MDTENNSTPYRSLEAETTNTKKLSQHNRLRKGILISVAILFVIVAIIVILDLSNVFDKKSTSSSNATPTYNSRITISRRATNKATTTKMITSKFSEYFVDEKETIVKNERRRRLIPSTTEYVDEALTNYDDVECMFLYNFLFIPQKQYTIYIII